MDSKQINAALSEEKIPLKICLLGDLSKLWHSISIFTKKSS